MKFLLTNDDGYDAPGLAALAAAASAWGHVTVVAPHVHVSGCSHQATTHRPLELTQVRPDWYMLDGSPADCTRLGLTRLVSDADWVLSGINAGGNLGADVFLSGTVAAAREACLLGKPAIAVSQYYRGGPIPWETSERWAAHVLEQLMRQPPKAGEFWNVNLPDPRAHAEPQCVFSGLDINPLPVQFAEVEGKFMYRGNYHERSRTAGCDVDVCFGGQISITALGLAPASDASSHALLPKLNPPPLAKHP